jgi:XTP/dITP diphosphohydrolase
MEMEEKKEAFGRILTVMNELREQCPWDRKQTIESLRNLTIEEVFELAEAISEGKPSDIEEELGDILLHIIFYAKIGEENNQFDIVTIIDKLIKKLVHRHPHIYGDVKVQDDEEVKKNWEQLKLKEGKKSVLGGVPKSLPAMIKAHRMQDKAAQVGFDWPTKELVWAKVEEELHELKEAEKSDNKDHIQEEFGDVLFSLINYARFLNIDPESALESINIKFKTRFHYIEDNAHKPLVDMSLEEMDVLWNEAKSLKK